MSFLKTLLGNNRRYKRFSIDKEVLMIIEPYTTTSKQKLMLDFDKAKHVQILNISEGGCAFLYNGSKKDLEESGILSLQYKNIPYLERIVFTTKSDSLFYDSKDIEKQLRVRRVEFEWLSDSNRERLKKFIERSSIASSE
jgi:hypothetical protein